MNNQNNKTAYANHNIEKRFLETAETFHGTFQSFRPFPKALCRHPMRLSLSH